MTVSERLPAVIGALVRISTGIVAGVIVALLITLPLKTAFLILAAVVALITFILPPIVSLSIFFTGIIFTTDAIVEEQKELFFAVTDLDIGEGLPSGLLMYFLLLFVIVMFRSCLLERRRPVVRLRYLAGLIIVLVGAWMTGASRHWPGTMMRVDLMSFLFPVLCFYLCAEILSQPGNLRRILLVVFLVSVIKAIILDAHYLLGRGWPYAAYTINEDFYRVVTMDSADLLAFITMLLVAAGLAAHRRIQGPGRVLLALGCIPLLFAVVFSFRRGQWVGMVLSFGLLLLASSGPVRRRLMRLALIGVLAGAAVIATLATVSEFDANAITRLPSRVVSVVDAEQGSNKYHRMESRRTMQDIMKSPFPGLGLGSSHSEVGLYENDLVPRNVVHNSFIYTWMKLGLAGLLFFFIVGVRYLFILSRSWRARPRDWNLILTTALGSSIGLLLVMLLTGPVPWYFHQTFLIALFAAMAVSLSSARGEEA